MKSVIITLLSALSLFAQSTATHYIGSTGDVVLAAAGTAMTIQQPATGYKNVILDFATIYCSAACTATELVNCTTPATTTAGSWVTVPGNSRAIASVNLFTASNASSCTTLKVNHVLAGQTFTLVYPFLALGANGQYTVSIASVTGTVNITIGIGESL